MHLPEIVAHRGYTLRYPENTIASVRAAIEAGARFVEIDVQLTADGVPVLFHDRNLERMCGVRGAVHQKTLQELREFHAADAARLGTQYSDEPIATLQEFSALLEQYPQVTAFVEVKRIAIERFPADAVQEAVLRAIDPIRDRSVIISFSLGFLQEVRRCVPKQPIAVVVDRWEHLKDPEVRILRPEYIFCDIDGLPKTGLLLLPVDARLVVYEVADGPLALQLARRGAEMIETFACAEMLQFMKEAKSH